MAFSFGFSGDDIDVDDSDIHNELHDTPSLSAASNALPELIKATKHDMSEWLPTLPSQISYNTLPISNTPPRPAIVVARREMFDIRAQLMAEDSAGYDNEALIAGLEEGDLKPHFYEGGFKTWECALDLAKLVTAQEMMSVADDVSMDLHIIELGAGTAVPSLALFARLLAQQSVESVQNDSDAPASPARRRTHFTFGDYNSTVLRLVTLPNLLLTWCKNYSPSSAPPSASDERSSAEPQPEEEELDITPELLDNFTTDLARRGISVSFISGAWSLEFVDLLFASSTLTRNQKVLVLASETIYSPSSLKPFSETLLALLRRADATSSTARCRALVAAKKVYFGVGGGVDEFLAVLSGLAGNEIYVHPRIDVQSEGVGRVILEIGRGAAR